MSIHVKVGRGLHDNEFGAIDETDAAYFEDKQAAYEFVRDYVGRGYRANVYDGLTHVGTFEEN